MVADVTNHPVALAAQNLFRAAVAETLAIARAAGKAATGLAGVVGQGVRGLVSAAITPQSTPAVAHAQIHPRQGKG